MLLPTQCAQLLEAFSIAGKFDMDLFNALERNILEQIELTTGAHLVVVFEAHAAWSAKIV